MNAARMALRLREQMASFLRNLPVCKPVRRFCLETLYGICESQSVRLSGIAHSLNESIPLIKTEHLAACCPLPYAETIWRENADGSERAIALEFGYREVRLPGFENKPLWMLVVKGFGAKPLMILTTVALRKNRDLLWWALEAYMTRWRIEETLRFAKQSYDPQDVRVLSYQRLENMMAMALLAMFLTMVHLGQQTKLEVLYHHALAAAKRIFGIPDFMFYAIADGLCKLLCDRHKQTFSFAQPPANPPPKVICLTCSAYASHSPRKLGKVLARTSIDKHRADDKRW